MPYADFTPGQPILSSTVEGLFNDLDARLLTVEGLAFSAYGSADASNNNPIGASNAETKVILDTEDFDSDSRYTTATARFTPNVAGWYEVGCVLQSLDPFDDADALYAFAYKNGAWNALIGYSNSPANVTTLCVSGSTMVQCNGTTDYVELYAQQTNAATRRWYPGSQHTRWFGRLVVRT